MLQEINQQLKPYVLEKRTKLAYQKQLLQLQKEKEKAVGQLEKLETQLQLEYRDVQRLEGQSPKSFFATISGNFDARYEKEYEEYLQAKKIRDAQVSHITELERQVLRLQHKLEDLGDIDADYNQLLSLKAEWLTANLNGLGAKYVRHLEHIREKEADLAVLEAAFESGFQIDKKLRWFYRSLNRVSREIREDARTARHFIKCNKAYAAGIQEMILQYNGKIREVQTRINFSPPKNLDSLTKFLEKYLECFSSKKIKRLLKYYALSIWGVETLYYAIISAIHRVRAALGHLTAIQRTIKRRIVQVRRKLNQAEKDRIRLLEEIGMEGFATS